MNEKYDHRQACLLYDIEYGEQSGIDHAAQALWVDSWRSQLDLPKQVLDLGCGPGRHLAAFERLGYACTGVDASREMLRLARRRLPTTALRQGYFHDFRVAPRVALVTSFFNTMSYNTSEAEFSAALANIRINLQPGGLFIFDVSGAERLEPSLGAKVFASGDLKFSKTAITIPHAKGYTSLTYFVVLEGDHVEVIETKTVKGVYSEEAIKSLLLRERFEVLYQGQGYATPGSTVFVSSVGG